MVGMFVFVPAWIGLLWTDFLKIRECASQLLHAWVFGFATMLATAQLVLVPFVMMQTAYGQYDPEMSGVVGFYTPPLKTYAFGLELKF